MLSNGKLIICSIAFLSLAACSGSDSGGKAAPYSKDNAKLNAVAQDFNRIQRSASSNAQHGLYQMSAAKPGGSVYEKSRRMEQAMARCNVQMSKPDQTDFRKFSFSLTIDGNCPISAKYRSSFELIEGRSLTSAFAVTMTINDATLAEMNDVYDANVSGYLNIKQNGVDGKTTGVIHSKQYGDVQINGTVTGKQTGQNTGRIEFRLGFTVQGELTEFVQVQEGGEGQETRVTYQINGKDVSAQEYQQALDKLGFLAQGISYSDESNVPPEQDDGTVTVPTEPGNGGGNRPSPPPAPPTGPSDELYCRQQVASAKSYWSQTDVIQACRSADAACVLSTINKKSYWTAAEVNGVCQYQTANCANTLIPLKTYFSATEVQTACKDGADSQCIAQMVKARPYASAEELNQLCVR